MGSEQMLSAALQMGTLEFWELGWKEAPELAQSNVHDVQEALMSTGLV